MKSWVTAAIKMPIVTFGKESSICTLISGEVSCHVHLDAPRLENANTLHCTYIVGPNVASDANKPTDTKNFENKGSRSSHGVVEGSGALDRHSKQQ